jgi:hypothetical protein
MDITRALLVVAAASLTTITGCAAAPEPEPKGSTESAFEEGDVGGSGGGGGGGASSAVVDPNTIYMKADNRIVHYDNRGSGAIAVSICEEGADPALIDKIKGLNGQPTLVIEKADGTFDTRLSEMPRRETDVYYCTGSRYGGTAYIFQLWQQDGGFLRNIDVSGAFISGLSGKRVGCEGGFQLTQGLGLGVRGFRVENGTIRQPEVTLTLDGQSTGQAQAKCYLKATSKHLVFAGLVPVYFEVSIQFGLEISVSKATTIHATIGTNGGSLETDDPTFTLTPQVELGVTFYGLVGAYVGADLPIALTPKPPCSPEITMGVTLKAGGQVGLIGFADLPINKTLDVEVSTPVLGPFTLRASSCE